MYVIEHKNHRKNILILDTRQDVTAPLNRYGLVQVYRKKLNDILNVLPHLSHLYIITDINIWYLKETVSL